MVSLKDDPSRTPDQCRGFIHRQLLDMAMLAVDKEIKRLTHFV
jgi:hypothetical protein